MQILFAHPFQAAFSLYNESRNKIPSRLQELSNIINWNKTHYSPNDTFTFPQSRVSIGVAQPSLTAQEIITSHPVEDVLCVCVGAVQSSCSRSDLVFFAFHKSDCSHSVSNTLM